MSLQKVRGQEQAVGILKGAISESRIAHAYLFLGPKGVGKTRLALEFAKLLNCSRGLIHQARGDTLSGSDEPDPYIESFGNLKGDNCGRCSSCIRIERLQYPDLFFISKDEDTTRISIEKIRILKQKLSLKPFEGRWKIAIIVEAEDMSEQASNCLLKVLEEPTRDTLFILTASNERSIPATVVSRCQVVRFRPLTKDDIHDILIKDFSMDEKEAAFYAAISGASISRALTLKERDALFWKNDIINAFNRGGHPMKQDTDLIFNDKREVQLEALDILLGFYRDILVYKYTQQPQLLINIDRIDTVSELSATLETPQVQTYIKEIEKTRISLEANANAKLALGILREKLT